MRSYEYGSPDATTVLIQPVDDSDLSYIDAEVSAIRDMAGDDFYLIALQTDRWNDDLSPWQAPPVFGKNGFKGLAAGTLGKITEYTCDTSKRYIIGGYSLAGLFSLWAAYQTDVFECVAAASPSVWFPGFVEYTGNRNIMARNVYLSLGDLEERTRNPVMATVGDNMRNYYELLLGTGTNCILEWNRGNHFKEPGLRTAKAFAWAVRS